MITDDPRLNSLVKEGKDGDIVIVGVPFHYSRKRVTGKGGEDNGPCCLRRFFPKVGPLVNPQYGISINQLNVSDYGNISAQAENQVVAPQKAITRISEQIYEIVKNNKLPFVFGGSKETSYGSALGFQQMFADSHHILIAGRPTLKRPFDGNKLNSDNLITLLQLSKNHNLTVFGMSDRYLPHEKSIQGFQNISYQQIRKNQVFQQRYMNTQGGSAFREVLKNNTNKKLQVSLSVEAIERFRGTRDVLSYGLTVEEMMEIFLWCGMCKEVKLVDICQFNPSIQDYESSLILVNLLYYFLMGWTKRPVQQNILAQ